MSQINNQVPQVKGVEAIIFDASLSQPDESIGFLRVQACMDFSVAQIVNDCSHFVELYFGVYLHYQKACYELVPAHKISRIGTHLFQNCCSLLDSYYILIFLQNFKKISVVGNQQEIEDRVIDLFIGF